MSRPRITLKLATSLDGKIALANGESEWITGEKARAEGRKMRGGHDAICVGANTAVLDNPQLTTREGDLPDPMRVVFDSQIRLLPDTNLAQTAQAVPVVLFCAAGNEHGESAQTLTKLGVKVLPLPMTTGGLEIEAALSGLWHIGVRSLLLEGGGLLTASFVKADVIDRIEWFRAPMILGGDGRDGVGPLGLNSMSAVNRLTRISAREIGDDMWETYE
ncbi:RibD family protein [Robiginitomaculum antarcticum]|uniref:RibD family protein n=1 Tax=Robiginitomaculum antarcticum TaxID=437507 RepID=UPI00037D0005|nr:RibD family protein [Robiginitomaculum antarcticum]